MRIVALLLIISLSACAQNLSPELSAKIDHNFQYLDKRIGALENANLLPATPLPTEQPDKQLKK